VQAEPALQALQLPAMQTRFVPQGVPFGTFALSAQTELPVAQDVAPSLQTFAGWHAAPDTQALQVPALQTRSTPQLVPLGRALFVIMQLGVGEQAVTPVRHGLVGTQVRPAVQLTQLPPLQTMFVPQLVPSGALPDSTQVAEPVLQVVVPVRQGRPAIGQVAPAAHAAQVPVALQTMFCPQLVPAGLFVPRSMQTATPLEQSRVPS
jgi:hypothetical protein